MYKSKNFPLLATFAALLVGVALNAAVPATDGEALDIVRTANNAEIAAAKLAKTNASSPKVRDFAGHMVAEHSKNNSDEDALSKKANISYETNDNSTMLKNDADAKLAELQKIPSTSKTFDKTYVEQQVAMHKALLEDLKTNLIPKVQNADVKAYLQKTKAHVEQHLAAATKLLSEL